MRLSRIFEPSEKTPCRDEVSEVLDIHSKIFGTFFLKCVGLCQVGVSNSNCNWHQICTGEYVDGDRISHTRYSPHSSYNILVLISGSTY